MKVLKKLFCVFIVLTMVMPFLVAGTYAFTDVDDSHKYGKSISSLVSLGLLAGYEDGSFKPDNTITRAEFAAVITRAMGMEKYVSNIDISDIFTDMKNPDGTAHWGSGYVKFAYDKEIIKGMGDNTFAPNSPVTYEQALKMVVCTLGYIQTAEEKGGWPKGYVETASDLGLTKNAALSPTDLPASRGIVAQIVYNALEVEMLDPGSSKKKTLLNDMLGIKEFKNYMLTNVDGSVTINSDVTGIKKGEILLEKGTEKLVVSYGDIETTATFKNYMGYYISGYYKTDDEGNNILVSLNTSSNKNKEITIESDDIETFDNLKLEYHVATSTRSEKVNISNTAQLVYNGMVYDYKNSGDSDERDLSLWLDPASEDFIYGSVKLLDSDGDSSYDAIFIEDYETYVVKSPVLTKDSIASNNYIVYDYYNTGKSVCLDQLDESLTIMIEDSKTGGDVKVENLKTMSVLSVAKSKDQTMFICKAAISDTVTGKITQKSGSQHLYTIGRKEYKVTKELAELIDTGKVSLDIGTSGTYYLDYKERIAAVKITAEAEGEYGYITIGALTGAASDVATVKILPLTGSSTTPERMDFADNAKINGRIVTSADDVIAAIENIASRLDSNERDGTANAEKSQLVRYVRNSNGEISNLTILSTDGSGNIKLGKSAENGDLIMGSQVTALRYSGSGNFGNEIFANASTKVLVVPDNRNETKGYKKYTGLSLFTNASSYNIEAYNISPSGVASVLLVYGVDTSKPINAETPIAVVLGKMNAINPESGNSCYMLEVAEGSYIKEYYTINASSTFEDVSVGDVVRFGYDGDGFVNQIRVEADLSNLVPESKHDSTIYNGDYKFKTILGTVASKSDALIMIAPEEVETVTDGENTTYTLDETNKEGYAKNDSVIIYRIVVKEGNEPKIENPTWESIVSFEDVKDDSASLIFAHAYTNKLKLIVIYTGDI